VTATSRERVEAALRLDVADHPPAGAWGHVYEAEWDAARLAEVTVRRAKKLGWDFVKFQPRATCFSEAFGARWRQSAAWPLRSSCARSFCSFLRSSIPGALLALAQPT